MEEVMELLALSTLRHSADGGLERQVVLYKIGMRIAQGLTLLIGARSLSNPNLQK